MSEVSQEDPPSKTCLYYGSHISTISNLFHHVLHKTEIRVNTSTGVNENFFLLDRKTKYPRREWVTKSMKDVDTEDKALRRKAEGRVLNGHDLHIFTVL